MAAYQQFSGQVQAQMNPIDDPAQFVQEPIVPVRLHFKYAIESKTSVIYTNQAPAFLEHLFIKAFSGAQNPGDGLAFDVKVWNTLDDGARIWLVTRFIGEANFGGVAIAAAPFPDPAQKKVWIRPSDGNTSVNYLSMQKALQQPAIGDMQPDVDHEEIFIIPREALSQRDYKIPRPMNAYMLYRADRHAALMAQVREQHPGDPANNQRVSIISGSMWRLEHPATRAIYAAMAAEVKRQFEAMYPQYKYRPRRQQDIHRRRKRTPVEL